MATQKKKLKKITTHPKVYLTKRLVIRQATAAVKRAANRAMQTAGYVIKVKDGYIVRENADGTYKQIKKIATVNRPAHIVLD